MAFTPKLNKNMITIKLGNHCVNCLLDSSVGISAISCHLLKHVAPAALIRPSYLLAIVGVCGECHSVLGVVDLNFEHDGLTFTQSFHVFEHLHVKILVGIDFLQKYNVIIKLGELEIPVTNNSVLGSVTIATTTYKHCFSNRRGNCASAQ